MDRKSFTQKLSLLGACPFVIQNLAVSGRPFRVDIAESLRRGGKTCHFIVHLS